MLVLSRKEGESITIEGGITVTVLSQQGENVRLGIEAPPWVRILRAEVDVVIADPPYGFREAGPVEDLPPEEAQP